MLVPYRGLSGVSTRQIVRFHWQYVLVHLNTLTRATAIVRREKESSDAVMKRGQKGISIY